MGPERIPANDNHSEMTPEEMEDQLNALRKRTDETMEEKQETTPE